MIDIEIQNDRSFNGWGGADERKILFTDSVATFGIYVNPTVSLQTSFHVEPVRDRPNSRIFDDHGLYLEQLYLLHDDERISGFAGKFNAVSASPGTRRPASTATNSSKITSSTRSSASAAPTRSDADAYGKHKVGLNLFLTDNRPLSYTAFEKRFPTVSAGCGGAIERAIPGSATPAGRDLFQLRSEPKKCRPLPRCSTISA